MAEVYIQEIERDINFLPRLSPSEFRQLPATENRMN
ncbi:Uncharacterised protein [uncultured archaeon]|nr:Uncharacterised protein [uncultured archaeon]